MMLRNFVCFVSFLLCWRLPPPPRRFQSTEKELAVPEAVEADVVFICDVSILLEGVWYGVMA